MERKRVIELAFEAMKNAYAPYSNFYVGSCVSCKDGKFFLGANVENASYGLSNCGERNAIFAAYSNGYRKEDIESIAIVCSGNEVANPCGACRQVLSELLTWDTPIYLANATKEWDTNIKELLPYAFTPKELND